MSLDQLHAYRDAELALVLETLGAQIGQGDAILDIGAGTGAQARRLADLGYAVEAIELADSDYRHLRVWPVTDYDGQRIPHDDDRFDFVFSSNVLEHVTHLEALHREIRRVLRPHGTAIHVLPTGTWRFWTTLTHYPFCAKAVVRLLLRRGTPGIPAGRPAPPRVGSGGASPGQLLRTNVLPPRHGERGNFLTETLLFSGRAWTAHFTAAGWQVVRYRTNGLFYTGSAVLGRALPLRSRQWLSHLLGSSCHIYFLRPC